MKKSYVPRFEKLVSMKAFVTAPNGRRVRCKRVQDKSLSGEFAQYDDSRVRILSLSEVAVGSVLEVEIVVKVHSAMIPGQFFDRFSFDEEFPVKEARYSLTVPKGKAVYVHPLNGLTEPLKRETKDTATYFWDLKDVDKVRPEPLMPPWSDEARLVRVTTWKDWSQLDAWYFPLVQKAVKETPEIRKKAEELAAGAKSLEEKIQRVFNFIDDDVRYVSLDFGMNRYDPHPAAESLADKFGDCKDRAILAKALLRVYGVEADPVLFIDDGNEAPRPDAPSWDYFNHEILAVKFEGKTYFVESTDGTFPFRELHPGLEGGHGFLIDGKGGRLIEFPREALKTASSTAREEAWLDEDGGGRVRLEFTDRRYALPHLRNRLKAALSGKDREEFFERFGNSFFPGVENATYTVTGEENRFGPISLAVEGTLATIASCGGPLMIIDPEATGGDRDFSKPERQYPLWFRDAARVQSTRVYHFPKGFSVLHLPENVHMESDYRDFSETFSREGRSIRVTVDDRRRWAEIPASDYAKARKFSKDLNHQTSDKIILKKN